MELLKVIVATLGFTIGIFIGVAAVKELVNTSLNGCVCLQQNRTIGAND